MSSADRRGGLVVTWGRTCRHRELWPSLDVRKTGSIDVGIRVVGGVEGDDSSAIGIVDVPQIAQSETMDEVTGWGRRWSQSRMC